jgi:Xaa-Pro dipeptidase
MVELDDTVRSQRLLDAQEKASALFAELEHRDIVVPGVREREASDAIRDLAADMFGVTRHWHKRVVRAGLNTLHPYRDNPPDREISDDDIVFCDFGPIFEEWEADFARTFVIGDDPAKHQLRDALPRLWENGRVFFEANPEVTGEALFEHTVGLAHTEGWGFGGVIAGHLVGV